MHVCVRHLSQDTFDFQNNFLNFEFPNLSCGSLASTAYMSLVTVFKVHLIPKYFFRLNESLHLCGK